MGVPTVIAGSAIALSLVSGLPLEGQGQDFPLSGMPWPVQTLREYGGFVAPVYEGWYHNEDGGYSLVFGYFNLNSEEVVEIPLGPDNFIQPREFDGMQPTHFDPIPKNGFMRHWGVFTVRVPEDVGDRRVVWTLRHRGRTWEIPGHISSPHYILDEIAIEGRNPLEGTLAPVLKFAPGDPGVRGRNGIITGPLEAKVGIPLSLSAWVDPDPRPGGLVWWFKHQGPGEVVFSPQESPFQGGAGEVEVTTMATFSESGEYILRLQAVEDANTLQFHCCWTNGYVKVSVIP